MDLDISNKTERVKITKANWMAEKWRRNLNHADDCNKSCLGADVSRRFHGIQKYI